MSFDNSNEDKTEAPSEHRLKQSRKRGDKFYSRELHFLLIILVSYLFLWCFQKKIYFYFNEIMIDSLSFDNMYIDDERSIVFYTQSIIKKFIFPFLIFMLSIIFIALVMSMCFSGSVYNFKKINFDISKINVLTGCKKIFSISTWKELFKVLLRIMIVSFIFVWYFQKYFVQIIGLSFENPNSCLYHGCSIVFLFILVGIIGVVPTVLFDVYLQYKSYYKRLKMSHYELREEYKQTEGNPQIKSRIRQEMKFRKSQKMMLDIKKSNVIITNPVHYAVALYYDESKMNAPKILAKGSGYLALQICRLGKKNLIPILQSPILARTLYNKSKIGDTIPKDLFIIIAEVLAWVWKLKQWKKKGGTLPRKPNDLTNYKYQ